MDRSWTAVEIAPTLLPQIPIYDVGPNFPMELALRVGERAYDLLAMATAHVPRPVLRLADRLARRWLVQNNSPYLAEITALAQTLPRAWALLSQCSVRVGVYDSGPSSHRRSIRGSSACT